MSGSIEICRPESTLQLIMQHTQHSLAQFHSSQNSCSSSPPDMDRTTMLAKRLETPCSPPTASANTAGPANHRRFESRSNGPNWTKSPLSDNKSRYSWLSDAGISGNSSEIIKPVLWPSKLPTSQHHCARSKPCRSRC